jgi:hypothetical protein
VCKRRCSVSAQKKLTAAKDNEQAALVAKREAEVAARMALNAERIKEEERKKKAAGTPCGSGSQSRLI